MVSDMKTLNCWLISCLEVLIAILFLIFWGIQCGFSIYSNLPKSQMGYLATLSCLVAVIPAIVTAIYTYMNYDEVISAGVARWTSSTKLLEGQIKYSLNRMFVSGAFWALFLFMFLPIIAPKANYGFFFGYHPNASSKVEKNTDDEALIEKTDYDWLSQRKVTESDLEGKSKEELRIMRNYIFARHGYIFKSKSLKKYFKQFDWYSPKRKKVSSELSQVELDNVSFIKSYETKL